MKILLFLVPVALLAQTELPGPVLALPSAGSPRGVCSWNLVSSVSTDKTACLIADAALTSSNAVLTASNTQWTVDRDLLVVGNVLPNGALTGSLGVMGAEWLSAHIQAINNYGPNAFTIYSDVNFIQLDTGANQPIKFLTNNVQRAAISGTGVFQVSNMAGFATRCVNVDNSGNLSVFTDVCASTNNYLKTTCNTPVTLTTTYTSTSCTITATITGVWLLMADVSMTVNAPTSNATFALFINGVGPYSSSVDVGVNAIINGGTGEQIATSVSRNWVAVLNPGDSLDIRANSPTGSGQSGFGNFTAIYLHP